MTFEYSVFATQYLERAVINVKPFVLILFAIVYIYATIRH